MSCGLVTVPVELSSEVHTHSVMAAFTLEEAREVERQTRDQAACELWHQRRLGRITASNFGQALKRRNVSEAFVQALYSPQKFTSEPTHYGSSNEAVAKQMYLDRFPDRHIHSCGLLLQPRLPFLGASPDGLICDKGKVGVLEIKCPYGAREMTIDDAAVSIKDFYVQKEAEEITISKSHNCYYQVQGQMLLSGLDFCDFVLYTKRDFFVQRVHKDIDFINRMVERLHVFHEIHFSAKTETALNSVGDSCV